jgi:hypothetical protein
MKDESDRDQTAALTPDTTGDTVLNDTVGRDSTELAEVQCDCRLRLELVRTQIRGANSTATPFSIDRRLAH